MSHFTDNFDNSTKIHNPCVSGATPIEPFEAGGVSWKKQAQRLRKEAHVFYFAFKHSRMPWSARLVAVCTAGYLFSPVQLIPSFIPVIGFLDDFVVLLLGVKLLQRITPPDVLAECRELAKAAEVQRRKDIETSATAAASVVIAVLWMLMAVGAGALIVYVYY